MDIDEMEAEESEIIERKVVDECLRRMAILGIDKTTRAVCSTFYQSMLPLRFGWEAFLEGEDDEFYNHAYANAYSVEHDLGNHARVYIILHAEMDCGIEDACLYVDDNEEDWAYEREELRRGRALAYVVDLDEEVEYEWSRGGSLQYIWFERTGDGKVRRTH